MTAYVEIADVRLELERWPSAPADDAHLCETHTWHDTTASKAELVERIAGHGAHQMGPAWRESTLATFRGYTRCGSRTTYQKMRNQLAAIGAGLSLVTVRVVDDNEDTWRLGHVIAISIDDDLAENQFTWSIDTRCLDPRRYGPKQVLQEQVAAEASLTNNATNPKLSVDQSGWKAWARTGGAAALSRERVADGFAARATAVKPSDGIAVGMPRIPASGPVGIVRLEAQSSIAVEVSLALTWWAGDKVLRADVSNPARLAARGTWQLLSWADFPAKPATATHVTVAVDAMDQPYATGSWLEATRLVVGAQSSPDYVDGDSLGWQWLGTPGLSASAKTGTSWQLDNRLGTAPSTPAIEFTATSNLATGFTLRFHGKPDVLTYRGRIQHGAKVELLPDEHAILVNGSLSPTVAVGTWPTVAAGQMEQLALYANTPAGFDATCTWSPAWW